MKKWQQALARAGINVRPMDEKGHWRTTNGAVTADYWPATDKWRDESAGAGGFSIRSLIAHYQSHETKDTN